MTQAQMDALKANNSRPKRRRFMVPKEHHHVSGPNLLKWGTLSF